MGRSILAVFVGTVIGVVLTLATDVVLHAVSFFPPWGDPVTSGPLAVATAYRAVYGVLASYVMARMAPHSPMHHAIAGGILGLIVSTIGAVVTWDKGPAYGPHWYPVALIILALPTAWLGGKIYIMKTRKQ